MKFYAFHFDSGRQTTTGQPNEKTGRLSTAGKLAVFSKKRDRDEWVDKGKITSDMRGNCRESITAKEARYLKRGLNGKEYRELIEFSVDDELL